MTVSADSAPEMAHTIVDRLPTGMPSSDARSEFSASARMATPERV